METHNLHGITFIVTPNIIPVPRFQVSPEFARIQSPELVAKTNAWMEAFFGVYYPMYSIDQSVFTLNIGNAPTRGQKAICVHVSDWPNVKAKLEGARRN